MIEPGIDEALYASMWKWRAILTEPDSYFNPSTRKGFALYAHTCGLCNKYAECHDCPVYLNTGETSCSETPFGSACAYIASSLYEEQCDSISYNPVESEYDFLCSLQHEA